MLMFLLGMVAGVNAGIILMCILAVSKREEDR